MDRVAMIEVTIKDGLTFEVEQPNVSSTKDLERLVWTQSEPDRHGKPRSWITIGDVLFNRFEVAAIEITSIELRQEADL